MVNGQWEPIQWSMYISYANELFFELIHSFVVSSLIRHALRGVGCVNRKLNVRVCVEGA
jgi:hypothetical protein